MKVITKSEMKKAEALAVKNGSTYLSLMENAGDAVYRFIKSAVCLQDKTVAVLCGCGNNGGDGFVVARKLAQISPSVTVLLCGGKPKTEDAKTEFQKLPKNLSVISHIDTAKEVVLSSDIIVDALFGTGLSREIDENIKQIIVWANSSKGTRFSIDVPSGTICDTGKILGCVFKADYTVTFEALKPCHILPPSNEYCGKVTVVDIGIQKDIIDNLDSVCEVIEPLKKEKLPKNSHKGTFGTALSVCGSYGMAGAAILSSKAAIRTGVGIMKTSTIKENYSAIVSSLPETVTIPLESQNGKYKRDSLPVLKSALCSASALLIGCGMGVSNDTAYITRELALSSNVPVLIDADGINCIASDIEFIKQMKAPLILTPHPAEMARLCHITTAEVIEDRIGIARRFAEETGSILVLKGANTIVAAPDKKVFVNCTGNAGMATAGSGDVLSGIITALLARGLSPIQATTKGVRLHADAGDRAAARLCETSLIASDIIDELPFLF